MASMTNPTPLLFPIEPIESDPHPLELSEKIANAMARLLLQVAEAEAATEVIEDES